MACRDRDAQFLAQARGIVGNLYTHNPRIYWLDFFVSLTIGYTGAILYLNENMLPIRIAGFLIGGLALYRVALFMHEIVHFRKGEMPYFSLVWNLLAGIPLLMPTFFYEPHRSHHNSQHYGTEEDGEYLPLGNGPLRDIWLFMAQVFVQPIFVAFRFTILTPISFLHPKLRKWVLEHASSFVIDYRYRRPIPENAPLLQWALMDIFCSIRAWCIFGFVFAGFAPLSRIPALYLLAAFILGLNYLRTLAAHRYRSDGDRMSHVDQLRDSIDITGDPILTELLCPVGLRYHALHHLFPSIPYHNLGIAHRRLLAELPGDSPYHSVVQPSMWAVLKEIISEASKRSRNRSSGGAAPSADQETKSEVPAPSPDTPAATNSESDSAAESAESGKTDLEAAPSPTASPAPADQPVATDRNVPIS